MGDQTCLQCTVRARRGTGSDVEEMGGSTASESQVSFCLNQNSLICWWIFWEWKYTFHDMKGMMKFPSWSTVGDHPFLLLITDTYHLSKVRNHHFAQRNVQRIDGGSCLGMSLSFICQSGDPQGRKPEANQRNLTLPTLLGVWFSQIDHNSSIWGWMMVANVMGNFRFFREELAGSIPWGCILGEQGSCSVRSMEIERNWPDPMEENRPENWEVSFMPSFFFDEFGLWLSAKSWKRSTTKMQLLGPTPKEVWGSTIWRFSTQLNDWNSSNGHSVWVAK